MLKNVFLLLMLTLLFSGCNQSPERKTNTQNLNKMYLNIEEFGSVDGQDVSFIHNKKQIRDHSQLYELWLYHHVIDCTR